MKKTIWITFVVTFILVNILAWAAQYFGDVHIAFIYRLVVILAVTFITLVFAGAWHLMNAAAREDVRNTGRRE